MTLPTLPPVDVIADVERRIETATREDYELWRYASVEAFRESGAHGAIQKAVSEWMIVQVQSGRLSPPEAGVHTLGGAMACAFQLGLLVGAVFYGAHKFDGDKVQ